MTEGIELQNYGKIRTHIENETYKYLGILEADILKRAEMKEKFKKSSSEKRENNSKSIYIEIL